MKRFFYLIFIWICVVTVSAQEMGSWKTFFSYGGVEKVIQSKDKIFALGNGVLFSVDKSSESIETYTKTNGLSDCYISQVNYNEQMDAMVLVYDNANIDIVKRSYISNILDFKRKDIGGKLVNSITSYGEYTYLACDLGIVVVDIKKEEIADTYVIGDEGDYLAVYKIEILNDTIYAQTPKDIRKASLHNRSLADYAQWEVVENIENVSSIANFKNKLVVVKKDSIYVKEDDSLRAILPIHDFKSISVGDDNLIVTLSDTIINIDNQFALKEYVTAPYSKDAVYNAMTSTYWVAGSSSFADNVYQISNLLKYQNQVMTDKIVPNGMYSHAVAFVKYQYGMLITGSGGPFDIPRRDNPGVLQILEGGEWSIITGLDFEAGVTIRENSSFVDVLDAIVDPTDHKRIYVATWRSLFEIYDKKPYRQYWTENSSLGNSGSRILVDGLCFDSDNNLWMTNMVTPNGLSVLKNDGTWQSFYYEPLDNLGTIKETFISSTGLMWILRPRLSVGTGVFVIDQKGTPFNSNDDKTHYYASFTDKDGNVLNPNAVRCIAEDKNNAIWIGTSVGPLIVNKQADIFNADFRFDRIKITREDDANYADYLLSSDQINAIVIDGGNRKWIGSATSGVYLLSEDGKETLIHFTTDNSPLTSNSIIDMAMNQETGELFIACSNGLFSYMTNSTIPSNDYSNVYVYPNPVTPDFEGMITVNGLVENSLVRIADIEGNVIFEDYSNGGTFIWNGRNRFNERVATGIYYIFAAQEDGSMKMVTKLAFIH